MPTSPLRPRPLRPNVYRHAPYASLFGVLLVLFCAAFVGLSVHAAAPAGQSVDQLKPLGYVSDFADVLSPSARGQITQLCTEIDQKAQAQIAVVTVRTLGGQSAFDYSFALATRWGVGPKQKDRGVLILVAVGDHKYYTQVGYGLEGILPDGKVGGFGREAVPYFRQNNYDAGILLMTKRVADVIAADRAITLTDEPAITPLPETSSSRGTGSEAPSASTELIIIAILLILIFRVMRAFAFAGSSGRYYRRHGGWWIGPMMGGGFGGGGWSGGGGGGFGGFGGGSFGGGGAGGSW